MYRHDVVLISASGRDATAIPAPAPLSTASNPVAYARALRGISSTATTAIKMSRVSPKGRPIVCVATKKGNEGDNAPAAEMMGAAHAIEIMRGRRP